MSDTYTLDIARIDLGMPGAPVRVSAERRLPVIPDVLPVSAYDCALNHGTQTWDRSVTTDAAVEGAFPGPDAWSPPA